MENLPKLLLIVGVVLQFLVRARKPKSEGQYLLWAVAACASVYVLAHWPFPGVSWATWNQTAIAFVLWIGDPENGALAKVLAATAATSLAASAAVRFGADPEHPAVPVTKKGDE